MAKPTPGPWTIEEYGDEEAPSLVIHKDSATRVCFMATPGSHGDPARIEADAHLIAAAPEMLAALKAYQEWTDKERAGPQYPAGASRDNGGEAIWRAWWEEQLYLCDRADTLTRTAIAKAESASPARDMQEVGG